MNVLFSMAFSDMMALFDELMVFNLMPEKPLMQADLDALKVCPQADPYQTIINFPNDRFT